MSFATWKKEFYPCVPDPKWDDIKCLEHSIQKWIGLRPENLDKHGVIFDWMGVHERANSISLEIAFSSCACCIRAEATHEAHIADTCSHVETEEGCNDCEPLTGHAHEQYCEYCPLYQSRGGFACDIGKGNGATGEQHGGPYFLFTDTADPEPMIAALKAALKWAGGRP